MSRITPNGWTAIIVAAMVISAAGVAVLHLGFNAFLFIDGADCDGCIHRKRRCIGIPRETDMHGGERWHCIGVPVGPWYCYREVRTEHEEQWVPVPCLSQ